MAANYTFHSRQNYETFDTLHAFLSSVVAKLCDLKNSPVFFGPPGIFTSADRTVDFKRTVRESQRTNRKGFYRATAARSHAASAVLAVAWCLSVRLSVTFVYCVETSKYILKLLSPSGRPTILVLVRTKRCGNIPTGPLLGQKSRFFTNISVWMTGGVSSVINKFLPSSMLITASVDLVYISRRPRRKEQNIIYLCAIHIVNLKPKYGN